MTRFFGKNRFGDVLSIGITRPHFVDPPRTQLGENVDGAEKDFDYARTDRGAYTFYVMLSSDACNVSRNATIMSLRRERAVATRAPLPPL